MTLQVATVVILAAALLVSVANCVLLARLRREQREAARVARLRGSVILGRPSARGVRR